MTHATPSPHATRSGFSLVEVLLAMMVFAIAVTTILALLARSLESVARIAMQDEAMRLSSGVEKAFRDDTFNNVYNAVAAGSQYYVFHYRAQISTGQTPYAGTSGIVGEDYVLAPAVLRVDTPIGTMQPFMDAREGNFFLVRTQISPTNPTALTPNPDDYPSAVVVIYAEYFNAGRTLTDAERSTLFADQKPVYAYNFAVRR